MNSDSYHQIGIGAFSFSALVLPSFPIPCVIRSQGMKDGYAAELSARQTELDRCKDDLEALYMNNQTEEDLQNNQEYGDKFRSAIDSVAPIVTALQATLRTVKLAVETNLNNACFF